MSQSAARVNPRLAGGLAAGGMAALLSGGIQAAGATRTVNVDDPVLNQPAYSITIPKDWGFSGMIARPRGCHGPAVAADGLTYTALSSDGITANEKLPGAQWAWVSDGSALGKCNSVRITSAAAFLLNIAIPNLRPDARNITLLPLPPQMQQALDAQNQAFKSQFPSGRTVDSARVRYSYTYLGRPVDELLFTIVSCQELDMPAYPALHRAAVQRHLCNSNGVVVRRAARGALDALLAQPAPAVQINAQWDATIQQRMRSQFAAWQHENDEQFRAIQQHYKNLTEDMLKRGRQFQAQQKNSFDNAMAQDRATQGAIDHAAQMQVRDSLNRQDFLDPRTGQRIETSNELTHTWISADGTSVVGTNDGTFDPNGVIDPVRQSWTELIPVN